jgi:peptidoglycan/LPS O-acetylase OafA/YrhL
MSAVTSSAEPRSGGRIAGLDLLRGVAIALVMVCHAFPTLLGASGIIGVVLFFTLSGFLITGLLVSDLRRFSRVRYGRFYRNRALRLIPALLLFLAGLAVVSLTLDPAHDRAGLPRALLVGISYTADIPFNHGSGAIDHLWTLATEEQFYLVWPAVLALGFWLNRIRLALVVSAVGIIAALVISMIHFTPNIWQLYHLPSSWAIAMVIGAAARLGETRIRSALERCRVPLMPVAAIAFAAILGLAFLSGDQDAASTYLLLGPGIALLSVPLILYLSGWQRLPSRWLSPLLALGVVSYAAYLWNYAIVVWLGGMGASLGEGLVSIPLTLFAATVSWFALERPIARWRARTDARRTALRAEPAPTLPQRQTPVKGGTP